MIEKIVHAAKQTVNAIVDIQSAALCPFGALFTLTGISIPRQIEDRSRAEIERQTCAAIVDAGQAARGLGMKVLPRRANAQYGLRILQR